VYQLAIASANVTGSDGLAFDGDPDGVAGGDYLSPMDSAGSGAGYHYGLFRLFGDGTGNGTVDLLDLAQFRGTLNHISGDLGYLWYFDADENGTVDLLDLGQLRSRLNHNLF
jgi:Dockerin type I domain